MTPIGVVRRQRVNDELSVTVRSLFLSRAVNRTQCLIVIPVSHRLHVYQVINYKLVQHHALLTVPKKKYTVKLHDDMFRRAAITIIREHNSTDQTKNTGFLWFQVSASK